MSANSTQKILELFQVLICWYSIKVSIFTTRSQIQNKQTSPKETFSCTQNISKIHMPQRDRDFGCNFKVLGFRRVHGCISRSMVASAKAQPATTNRSAKRQPNWLMCNRISLNAIASAEFVYNFPQHQRMQQNHYHNRDHNLKSCHTVSKVVTIIAQRISFQHQLINPLQ